MSLLLGETMRRNFISIVALAVTVFVVSFAIEAHAQDKTEVLLESNFTLHQVTMDFAADGSCTMSVKGEGTYNSGAAINATSVKYNYDCSVVKLDAEKILKKTLGVGDGKTNTTIVE